MKLAAYFTGFSSKSDGSASLRFNTQEIPPEQFAEFQRNHNAFGWLVFQENANIEVPKEPAVEDKDKTPSKRLRSTLYVLWEKTKPAEDFETYYRKQVERMIDAVKNKLD